MTLVASRDLRNQTRELLDRVAAGETITITVRGTPVADLTPVGRRQQWMGRDALLARLTGRQADSALRDELTALSDETTDDLPL